MVGMSDLPSRVNRCRGCPHIIILQGILLLLTHLFIEGVSNRRDFIYVRAFAGVSKHVLGLLPEISALVVSGVPQSMIFNPCRIHVARRIPHGLETVGNACLHVA